MKLLMASINSKLNTIILAAVALVIAAFVSSCSSQPSSNKIKVDTTGLRNGNLIFREGPSFNSKVVKSMSDSQFSHVGMIYRSKGEWRVVHAVPDESESHETDYVKCEPIESFLDPTKAKSAKLMRVRCTDQQAINAVRYAITKANNKTLFDNDYDLNDTTRLYCTELVWQAYKHQGIDLVPKINNISVFGKKKEVIFPIDLLKSKYNAKEWSCEYD